MRNKGGAKQDAESASEFLLHERRPERATSQVREIDCLPAELRKPYECFRALFDRLDGAAISQVWE